MRGQQYIIHNNAKLNETINKRRKLEVRKRIRKKKKKKKNKSVQERRFVYEFFLLVAVFAFQGELSEKKKRNCNSIRTSSILHLLRPNLPHPSCLPTTPNSARFHSTLLSLDIHTSSFSPTNPPTVFSIYDLNLSTLDFPSTTPRQTKDPRKASNRSPPCHRHTHSNTTRSIPINTELGLMLENSRIVGSECVGKSKPTEIFLRREERGGSR